MKMEQETNLIKDEDKNSIEHLLEKPLIKVEKDIPEYVDVNSIPDTDLKTESEPQIFRCSQCEKTYLKSEYLVIHTALHKPDMFCPVCHQIFSCGKKYRWHINNHIKLKMKEDQKMKYTCIYCLKCFTARKNHIIHLRVHTNERPYKCEVCGEAFKQLSALRDHRVTHTKEKKYVCEICSGSFTTSSSLKRHKRKIHDKGRTLNCNLCPATFQNKADYKAHRSSNHPCTNFKRTCRLCSTVLFSNVAYKAHTRVHIDKFPGNKRFFKNFMCSLCGEEMNKFKVYSKHRHWHMAYTDSDVEKAMKLKSFKCKFCPVVYRTKQSLFDHMDLHLKHTVKCDLCQEKSTYLDLRAHKKKVHQIVNSHKVVSGKRKLYDKNLGRYHQCNVFLRFYHRLQHRVKNFQCSLCRKQFLTRHAVVTHKHNIHRVKVKFRCTKCCITFETLKEIAQHKSTHQNKKPSKRFRCKLCKKIFLWFKNYKTHTALKTCVDLFAKQPQLHACEFCNRSFAKVGSLKGHLQLHSRCVFQCRFCDKTYKMMYTIERHMKALHPDKKLYWCNICGQSFDALSKCEIHSNLHRVTKVKMEETLEGDAGASVGGSNEIKVEG